MMTITITCHGETRTVSDVDVVQRALRDAGVDLALLAPDFIDCALRDNCSVDRIVAIAQGREHLFTERTA